ncbi:MAG: hypothetical protein DPW09_32565 [Anaerolineae bacterium]|nr:hypothetical protein [Anaerolineae bacterium]
MNLRFIILLFVLITLLAGCGGQAVPAADAEQTVIETPGSAETEQATVQPEPTVSEPEPTDAPATVEATAESFPVTIEHKYGRTTITEKPERIVLVGLVEQDALLALGIVPVATREWWGERPGAIFEWATDKLGDAPLPEVLSAEELNFEQIARLKPDVIVGLYAGLTEEEYSTLSQIAPTVAQPAEHPDWGIPWQELTRKIGLIVGKRAEAENLIAEIEARFAQIREQHPEFAKASGVVVSYGPESYWAYSSKDPRGQFLTSLGFKAAVEIDEIIGNEFGASISRERLDLLNDMGIVVWFVEEEQLDEQVPRSDPIYQQLDVSKQGRDIVIGWEDPLAFAFSFNSVLSLPYVLDHLVPQIAAAVDGASTSSGAVGDQTRIIQHAMGETEAPANPQRVVVLDTGELDNALALGANIVGAPVAEALEYQQYLADQLTDITDTGAISEPNLETILSLKPDLILGSKQRHEEIYEQLSAIGPTVFVESLRVPWQDNFRLHAEALGKTAEAEQLLSDYDAHVAEVQAVLGDKLDSATVSIIRFRPGQVRLYLKSSYIGYILQDVGLPRPASQDKDVFSAEISLEQIAEVDADYIFVTGYAQDDSELGTFLESPLWQTLQAVQNERVIDVNDDTWIAGLGVQAANLVLDDLYQFFLKEDVTAGAGTTAATLDCEDGFRPFDHELLASEPLCLPIAPQRIVALDMASLELALLIGKPPVLTSDWMLQEMPLLLPQYADTLAGIEQVGYPAELEKVLLLKPDIILAPEDTIDVEQARAIAPLVIPDQVIYDDWKLGMQFWSEVLNVPDFYAEMEANYRTRVAELQTALGQPAELEISVISASTYGVYLWMPDSPPGAILADVGLARPEAQTLVGEAAIAHYGERQYIEISEERLDLADGEAIFYFTYASTDPKIAGEESNFIKTFEQKPLWQTLKAVKAEKAFFVPGYWWRSQSYLLANKVIDDLFTHLTDTSATTLVLEGQ